MIIPRPEAAVLLCEDCGFTRADICPECPRGCGCTPPSECDNWRHQQFDHDEEPEDPYWGDDDWES